MIEIFLYSFIYVVLLTPYGFILTNENKVNLYCFSKDLIFGTILICFIAIIINFFSPLNLFINNIILLIPLIVLIKNRHRYLNLKFIKFIILISILLTFLITESNVYRPDAGLYHLPFIGILNSEKIIMGLSNLHFRYGHTSIIQYLSAANYNSIFKDNGIVFAQAIIASAIMLNFIFQIHKYLLLKKYNFHLYFLFFILVFIFYKMNRYSEYGNDAPAHFIYFFFISEVILYLSNKNKSLINNLILSFFIIQNKILLIPVILFNFIFLKFNKIKSLFKNKIFYFLLFFFLAWSLKNIFMTGCFLYPVKESCFKNLKWSNIENTQLIAIESEIWAKGYSDLDYESKLKINYEEFLNNFYWLDIWSTKHLKLITKIMAPYLILCLLILLILYHGSKKVPQKKDKFEYYLISISFLTFIIWFIKAPLFRYGYSTIIIFLSCIFASILTSRKINYKKINYIFYPVCCILIVIFMTKNLNRIYENNNDYLNYPWPKYNSMTDNNNNSSFFEKKLNGKIILIPDEGYCMYSKKICTHYNSIDELKLKKSFGYYLITKKKNYNE